MAQGANYNDTEYTKNILVTIQEDDKEITILPCEAKYKQYPFYYISYSLQGLIGWSIRKTENGNFKTSGKLLFEGDIYMGDSDLESIFKNMLTESTSKTIYILKIEEI